MMMMSGILEGSHTFHDGQRIDADHRRITSNIVDQSHGDFLRCFSRHVTHGALTEPLCIIARRAKWPLMGDKRCTLTEPAPADSPNSVNELGSPAKDHYP